MILDDKKNDDLVVKSHALIEASYRLTVIEQQMILYAIAKGRNEGIAHVKGSTVTIDALDFATKFKHDPSNVYKLLADSVGTFFERRLEIHDTHPGTGKPRIIKTRWVQDIAYVPGAGLVEFTFAEKVRPYITRLQDRFTSYWSSAVADMTSGHAIRLYELLTQYVSIGERAIDLEDLKDKLGISGEYKAIKDFKIRVLDLAVKQINAHSDLLVTYTQTKTGKTITGFVFTIKKKVAREPKRLKRPVVDETYVKKHARPGESYDQAYRRLIEEVGQQRLDLEAAH